MSFIDKLAKQMSAGTVKKAGSKIMDLAAAPQKFAMEKLAETVGVEVGKDSEASAQNIVEKTADKLGIPQDSVPGNIVKALGVAGLEVFGDPTSILPVNKVAKGIKAVNKVLGSAKMLDKVSDAAKAVQKTDKFVDALADARKAETTVTKSSMTDQIIDKAKPIPPMNRVAPPEQVLKNEKTSFTGQYFKAEKQKEAAAKIAADAKRKTTTERWAQVAEEQDKRTGKIK
jgi:hypothetical protein